MGEKIVVGPFNRGLRNDVTPFNIDNDSFPSLMNAYQWRGRVKRKRGTSLLGRAQRYYDSTLSSYNPDSLTITLDANGDGNLITGFSLESNASIVPGTVEITAPGPTVYTDPSEDGTLSPSGSINYATGAITIAAEANNVISATFIYNPDLPIMGLESFNSDTTQFPATLAFDTVYSYTIQNAFPYGIYDVSFYKNIPTGSFTGYVEKTDPTALTWNGDDYQQFWTVNYQGALWATNGINVPFQITNIGMQYNTITAFTIDAAGPPAIATITTATNHGLVIGDFVYFNEIEGITGINFQTGYVTAIPAVNMITVEFPNATLGGAYTTAGIVQYLTNRSDSTKDCIRFYDGDPTNGSATAPTLTGNLGWVNFCPPLSREDFSIADLPPDQYYLVGARLIVPFKDRLLFIGPVVQTSSANSQVYLRDTIIYSQNGTAYYTVSFTDSTSSYPISPTTPPGYVPLLVPDNQSATPTSYWQDVSGFGGFITAGFEQDILTVESNEDVLILGFEKLVSRLVYSGNDIVPFNFFIINSDMGSDSTFSAVNMDYGVIARGSRGFIASTQTQSQRVDLEIPDELFQTRLLDNGTERVCAQRDYLNEWIYFTYPVNQINYKFPTQTLQFNYRDNSWAIFRECFTTYGQFSRQTGFTWATVGTVYPTWASWNQSWNAGASTLLQPEVIGGNQQGFILTRDEGTDEGDSLYIQDITNSIITSPDHCLNVGDYIIIKDALGTVGSQVNDKIFSVSTTTDDTFILNPLISSGLTYLGAGVIKRMYIPFIQSKQFPTSWSMGRKTRLGPQFYLLTTTEESQITLLIYLSQDASNPYNQPPIVPLSNSFNNALVYSQVLFTCPESTNLGLTPANTNLQMVIGESQNQIWHRVNTSLLGDTVQVGFTLSDEQMRDENLVNQFSEIEIHGIIMDVNPSQLLA